MHMCHSSEVVKGYQAAINIISTFRDLLKLLDNLGIQLLIKNFEKTRLPRELMPLARDISVFLQSLPSPPHGPVKLLLDKCLTHKTCFLLALVEIEEGKQVKGS